MPGSKFNLLKIWQQKTLYAILGLTENCLLYTCVILKGFKPNLFLSNVTAIFECNIHSVDVDLHYFK